MSKRKSDLAKLKEGYGQGNGADYKPFIKANRSGGPGTKCVLYDPISGRTVHLLSQGEKYFYLIQRWDPTVKDIQEQVPMELGRLNKISSDNGLPPSSHILTTDFLITYTDGHKKAFSIKDNHNWYKSSTGDCKKEISNLSRQLKEKLYWESYGIGWSLVLKEDLNMTLAYNIENVMNFYDKESIDPQRLETLYMHLIAHHQIDIDLSKERLMFGKCSEQFIKEIISWNKTELL